MSRKGKKEKKEKKKKKRNRHPDEATPICDDLFVVIRSKTQKKKKKTKENDLNFV